MTTLVAGATGATGRLLVRDLLNRGEDVRVIVRSPQKLPDDIRNHNNLSVIHASILDLDDTTMAQHVRGCDAVASCLGHNITLRGIWGPPFRLVTQATRRLCDAIKASQPEKPVKFVLMNTTGNRNRDISEPVSLTERVVVGILRVVIPPQGDNEQAANYLRAKIGQTDPVIQWVAVRPDSLIDEDAVTPYDIYASPVRSAIFDPGKTSRLNVGHFMADLITDETVWKTWKGQMPVIYNREA